MATRALAAAAAVRRAAGSRSPVLASCRRGGGGRSYSAQPEEVVTAEQMEAAPNSKNVEEAVVQEGRAATVLPDEVVDDADAAWVPDQETGVFVPAEEAASTAGADGPHEQPGASPSVLDQTVFVREEEMEDVERPAADMADADAGAK